MSEQLDQPVEAETPAGVEAGAPDAGVQVETEVQLGEDGEPLEGQPDDDTEEVEHDGQKYRIPKVLKPALLMQADYTRKTQEVAQQREALAARQTELVQQAEAQATTLEERATLRSVESSLTQYDSMDWANYTAQFGADATATAMAQWQQLRQAKATLESDITRKEAEHRSSREQAVANARREAVQQLQTEIPGFGHEMDVAITKTAVGLGYSPADLVESLVGADGKPDVRAWKVLAELTRLQAFETQHKAKTTTAQIAQKQAAITPARTVGQKAGGYKPGLADDLPIEEWNRRRQAQIAKR